MVIKLSMYVGLHDVYPAIEENFCIMNESENDRCLQFVSLREKMHAN